MWCTRSSRVRDWPRSEQYRKFWLFGLYCGLAFTISAIRREAIRFLSSKSRYITLDVAVRWPNQVDPLAAARPRCRRDSVLPALDEPEMIIFDPLCSIPSITCFGMGSLLWLIICERDRNLGAGSGSSMATE